MTDSERFRLFVSNVSDYAIYLLSPEGQVTSWNVGAQKFKGYTEGEIIGQHFSRFFTQEDRARGLPQHALECAAREGRFESEGWRVRKDGSRFWAHAVLDTVRNDEGELIGFAKITRDITERREAEKSLERAREALFQSQKLEAIGKLTGGIAHDFNNLLAVIVNGIEILSTRLHSGEDAKILESMQRAANRGAKLNQQMLSFARQQPLQPSSTDLNKVINGFEAVLRRVYDESVGFEIRLAPRLKCALVDPVQFEAALLNLVTNARDAMPEGGTLTVSTEVVALGPDAQVDRLPPGEYVCVSVCDTGVGMPPGVVACAVEPFFTTKPLGKGTGLGLSQVYGLMQQSNGGMKIESAPGEGTCIALYLPALEEEREESEAPERALIVDDEPDVLSMAVELFLTLGYQVVSANNGADALDILERSPDIGLLFTDVVMPGINGVELGQKARGINPSIKVLLASGYAGTALAQNNMDVRNFRFIQKPYRTADLLKHLRKN